MSFFDSFSEMLVILFAIVAGYAVNRLGILGGEVDKKISKLLLDVTLPAMILGAVCTGSELPERSVVLGMLGVAAVFYALEFAFALIVPPLLGARRDRRACGASPWSLATWASSATPWRWPSSGRRR